MLLVAAIAPAVASPAMAAPIAPSTVQPGHRVAAGIAAVHGTPGRRAIPLRVLDPPAYRAGKRRAAAEAAFGGGPRGAFARRAASPSPYTAVQGTLNQPGLSAPDNSQANQATPPDTTGAIGPANYVEMVNVKMAVYGRAGLGLMAKADLDAFLGHPGAFISDPQVQWDPQAGRWLYAAILLDPSAVPHNKLEYGWSKTADPTNLAAGWCHFEQDTGALLDDYPKLGHDDNHILIGSNVYDASDNFATARIHAISKPANGDTSCTAPSTVATFGSVATPLRTADNDLAFTPVPANTADASPNGYVIAADDPGAATGNQLMAWHVSGPAGAPVLTADGNIDVAPYALPAPAQQPDGPDGPAPTLDSLDGRLTQAVALSDPGAGGAEAVWTQHTVDGPGGRSVVRWYELLPAAASARQAGTVSDAVNFVFNGAISPAMNGTSAVVSYNVSGPTALAQLRARSRRGAMPLGQMNGEISLAKSAVADTDFSCSPCRWGDYAGASPDPLSATVVWGSNQLNGPNTANPAWATRNFALDATPAPELAGVGTNVAEGPRGNGDGVAGPGESLQLLETVANSGDATASGLRGSLASLTPGVTVDAPVAGYPSLAPGAAAAGDAPFGLTIGQGVPCGTDVALQLQLATGVYSFSVPITVPTGRAGDAAARDSVDVPRPIPDAGSVDSTLIVSQPGRISDVTVRIGAIRHPFDGDLRISLIGPDGTTVLLADGEGGSGHDYLGTTFDDAAATPIAAGTAPFTGSYRPRQPLAALKGIDQAGAWTLHVEDTAAGDYGTLDSWGTTARTAQCGPPVAVLSASPSPAIRRRAVSFDGSASSDDGTIVRYQWDLDGNGSFETDTGPDPTATHTYRRLGRVRVGLRVTDDAGVRGQTTASLRVIHGPPRLRLAVRSRQARAALLTGGLGVTLTSDERARATLSLTVARRRASAPATTPGVATLPTGFTPAATTRLMPALAAGGVTLAAGRRRRITLRLTRAGRRRIVQAGLPLRLRLTVRARDRTGSLRVLTRTVTVTRR